MKYLCHFRHDLWAGRMAGLWPRPWPAAWRYPATCLATPPPWPALGRDRDGDGEDREVGEKQEGSRRDSDTASAISHILKNPPLPLNEASNANMVDILHLNLHPHPHLHLQLHLHMQCGYCTCTATCLTLTACSNFVLISYSSGHVDRSLDSWVQLAWPDPRSGSASSPVCTAAV